MLIGLRKLKECKEVLPKISIILYNAIFYGYFSFLIIAFVLLQKVNLLTIGLAILLPINLYLVSDTIKDFSNKRKYHVGTLDLFMGSINIAKKNKISLLLEEFEGAEQFLAFGTIAYMIFSCFVAMGLSDESSAIGGVYALIIFWAVIPFLLIINNFFYSDIFNKGEVSSQELIKFENVEDLNEKEKNIFRELLSSALNEKGCITKKDVYDAYIVVSKNKKYRLAEEKKKTESEKLKRKIENAKEEYSFLISGNNQ